jgi:ribonuclease HI
LTLKKIKKTYNNEKIQIYSDSHYCIKILKSWYLKWIKEGTIDKRQNVDIIKVLYEDYYTKMNVDIIHVKSHTNSKDEHSIGNSEADKLARLSIYNYKKLNTDK